MSRETQAQRELEHLNDELDSSSDPDERRAIIGAIRDIERDLADEERWHEEGRERGWA